eukprot:CAMPEP_0177794516 /NCGR_PEP_ID=MMETSP0491_2-20121128/25696_1 /TAXON_ID=63592 /ORGANISM="Tetraselmis chuii, Strain PLY429" /LENGTH=472 /DNA_ID=CAMNT_0019317195 /DNA_START=212 /DNA_END=1627 /DNA_ORIENTATION=+
MSQPYLAASSLGMAGVEAAAPRSRVKNEAGVEDRSDIKCPVSGCGVYTPRGFNLRHHICAEHQRVDSVVVDGVPHRFCQQCTKLHPLEMFSGNKRACKERLDRHNKRRKMRKHLAKALEQTGAGSLNQKQILDLAVRLHSEMAQKVEGVPSQNTGSTLNPTSILTGEDSQVTRPVTDRRDAGTQVSDGLLTQAPQLANHDEASPLANASRHSSMAGHMFAPGTGFHASAFMSGMVSRHPSLTDTGRVSNTSGDFSSYEANQGGGDVSRFGSALGHQDRLEDIIRTGGVCFHCNGMGCNECARYYHQLPSHGRMQAYHNAHERAHATEATQERVYNLSMKIMGITPHHLPPSLRDDITDWLQCSPVSISGCMRPGCVHLNIDITLASDADYARALRNIPTGFAASVASADHTLPWCSHRTILWLPDRVIEAKDGAIVCTRPRASETLRLSNACVMGNAVWVSGRALRHPGVKL